MLSFIVIFWGLLIPALATTVVLDKEPAEIQRLFTSWESKCAKTKNSYSKTFTNIRQQKTLFYRVHYSDKKCEQPSYVVRIKALSKIRRGHRQFAFDLKYKQVTASCLQPDVCEKMMQINAMGVSVWNTKRWIEVSDHYSSVTDKTLHTLLKVRGNLLFYGELNSENHGRNMRRRPTSVDDSKFDVRARYLPVFLSTIK